MANIDLLAAILPRLRVVRGPDARGEHVAWCPFHPDGKGKPPHDPNLSVSERGFICRACGEKGGLRKLAEHLGIETNGGDRTATRRLREHVWFDGEGRPVFRKVRLDPKDFFVEVPDGNGGWRKRDSKRDGSLPVMLYGDDLLAATNADEIVWFLEGEHDSDVAREPLGLLGVTSGGATSWKPELAERLRGRIVRIVPHNDAEGERFAQQVAASVHGVAADVRIVRLPAETKDAADWTAAGGTKEALLTLAEGAAEWTPGANMSEAAPTPAALTVVAVGELFAQGEPPPIRYLVAEIVPEAAFGFLSGSPDSAKSWQALDLTRCLATGTAWLGRFEVATAATVLYLDLENPAGEIRRRLWALATASEMPPQEWAERDVPLHIATGFASLASEKEAAELGAVVRDLRPALVVADSWARLLGGLDENASTDMARATAFLARLTQETGCAWLVLTHPPKMRSERDVPEAAVRGSGDLAARADYQFESRRLADGGFLVSQMKNRLGMRLAPFTVGIADTEEGIALTMSAPPDEWAEKVTRAEQIILAHLGAEGEAARENLLRLVKDTGLPERAAGAALTALRKREPPALAWRKDGKATIYSLASRQPAQGVLRGVP